MLSNELALLYTVLIVRRVGFNTDSADDKNGAQRLKSWLNITGFVHSRIGFEP